MGNRTEPARSSGADRLTHKTERCGMGMTIRDQIIAGTGADLPGPV
jgi:hypothetical protein